MKKGFTLIEIVIVIVIAWILLSMTFNLWWDYIDFLRYKQDREAFVNMIDKTILRTRATNYYDGLKYDYLDVFITDTWIEITLGTWDTLDAASCGNGVEVDRYDFVETSLSWHTDTTVRIVPFNIECDTWVNDDTNACAPLTTWLNLHMVSNIGDD